MSVCLYICVYIYICIYIYMCACIYVYLCLYLCLYICLCVYIYIYIYICVCVCVYRHTKLRTFRINRIWKTELDQQHFWKNTQLFLTLMKARWDEEGRRILLGDNTGGEEVMLRPIRFQLVGSLDFRWSFLYLSMYLNSSAEFHVLFPISCFVSNFMFCSQFHVLFPISCFVSNFVFCFQSHILFPISCFVSNFMFCFQFHILFPISCFVSNLMFCFQFHVFLIQFHVLFTCKITTATG